MSRSVKRQKRDADALWDGSPSFFYQIQVTARLPFSLSPNKNPAKYFHKWGEMFS